MQIEPEVKEFQKLLRDNACRSYLEIGCKFGGSLKDFGGSLPDGSRIVAVDLPINNTLPFLEKSILELRKKYEVHLFLGDSTSETIVEQVRALSPFDAILIDGNHTLPYVTKDWQNYGPMGKMIAFHDIAWWRETGYNPKLMPIEVPQFWNNIKKNYRHIEIKHEKVRGAIGARECDNGIGVLWTN